MRGKGESGEMTIVTIFLCDSRVGFLLSVVDFVCRVLVLAEQMGLLGCLSFAAVLFAFRMVR